MRSFQWVRTMPLVALMIAALAASAGGGCGDDGKKKDPPSNTGGAGGDGGGTGGVGGEGGDQGPVPCEVNDDCQPGERCDDVEKICVPRCTRDRECGVNTGLRCDTENGGICVPGEPCDIAANCGDPRSGHTYCEGQSCYCQEDETMQQADPPANGVCWRRSAACDECEVDTECGDNGACVPYNYDGETKNVCLRKPSRSGACAAGMVLAESGPAKGLCVPQYEDCGRFKPCVSDDDCDQLNPVCDLRRQVCIPGCSFDFIDNKSVGCPPERVCHMTAKSTDPTYLGDCALGHLWGVGRCDTACNVDEDCQRFGDGLVCEAYGNENRCVPADAARKDEDTGERIGCMSDDECAISDSGSGREKGYCDVATFTCVDEGCRRGPDWRLGCNKAFEDCTGMFKCDANPDTNPPDPVYGICVDKDCVDLGGAAAACGPFEFCATEPYRDPFTGELSEELFVETPPNVGAGECYPMDEGKWCIPCQSDADCASATMPTDSVYPPKCFAVGESGEGFCAPGCSYRQECPYTWQCADYNRVTCVPAGMNPQGGMQFCVGDADCPTGKCVAPKVLGEDWTIPDNLASDFKFCSCDPGAGGNACGPGYTCNAGIGTKAPDGGEILEHYCMEVDVCGLNGSCEFLGVTVPVAPDDPDSKRLAVMECLTDNNAIPGVKVDCPPGTFPGGESGTLHNCIETRVCIPMANNEDTCGLNTE